MKRAFEFPSTHRGSDIFLHIPTIGNFENGFTEGMIFHTPTAHRVRLRSKQTFRLFDRMGLNWLEQSRDPSSENERNTPNKHTHTRRRQKRTGAPFYFSASSLTVNADGFVTPTRAEATMEWKKRRAPNFFFSASSLTVDADEV